MRAAALASIAALALIAATAAGARDVAAFDAELQVAILSGGGADLDEGKALQQRLLARLPPDDDIRRRRMEAMLCLTVLYSVAEARALSARIVARESAADGDALALALGHACPTAHAADSEPLGPILTDFDQATEAARRAGDPALLAHLLVRRGGVHSLRGDFAKALRDALEADELLAALDAPTARAVNAQAIGIAYRRMGDVENAERRLKASLDDPAFRDDWAHRITSLSNLGYLYDEIGRPDEARRWFDAAIALCTANESPADCAHARVGRAAVDAVHGRPDAALRIAAQARADFEAADVPVDDATLALIRGQALAALGRHDEAIALLDAAVARWRDESNARDLALALDARASAFEASGRWEDAARDLRELVEVRRRAQDAQSAQRTEFLRETLEAREREAENARLRESERQRSLEIEALSERQRWQRVAAALALLAAILLGWIVLRQRWRARSLRALAATDPLTGTANRRTLMAEGERLSDRVRSDGEGFAALVIDVDHFKSINDAHGHAAGDEVLRRVATTCAGALRGDDVLARSGGEEFVALLPRSGIDAAVLAAERIRAAIEALDLDDVAKGLRASVSVGAATYDACDDGIDSLLSRTDKAMYAAKASGRNRVSVAATSAPPDGAA